MTRTLSTREKRLAILVGAIAALFALFFSLDYFQTGITRRRTEIASRTKQLALMKALSAESATVEQHATWLDSHQPRLTKPDSAGVQLLDEVKTIAQRHGVLLENPSIRSPETRPECIAVMIEVESKSPWSSLIAFQHELQNPEKFIALENTNLRIDGTDPTRMHGRFKISRWYAAR